MSLTKVTYSMISGAPVNVLDYGAVADNTTDCTSAIQAALAAGDNVVIPSGEYVVDGTITLSSGKSLILDNATITKTSSAVDTNPVINITGSRAVLQGIGSSSIISQKHSPKGVVGIYDPNHVNSIYYPKVLNLYIAGDSDTTSNLVYAETGKQQGGTGVTYFANLDGLILEYAANGVYLTAECNAFLISNIVCAHLSTAAFNFVGTAAADANVYGNAISNAWFTNGVGSATIFARMRYATQNAFTNCMAEQGGASALFADCDATAQANTFKGVSNVNGGSVSVNGSNNFFEMNGTNISDIGTWTPTIIGATTAGTNTYISQFGQYIQLGRLVYVQFFVNINSKDAAMAGHLLVDGLPFTSNAMVGSTDGAPTFAISNLYNVTLPANFTQVSLAPLRGSKAAYIVRMGSGVASFPVQASEIASGFSIGGSGFYMIGNVY